MADTEGKMLRTLSVTKPNVSIPKPAQNFWQTLRLPSSKPIHIITNQEERERGEKTIMASVQTLLAARSAAAGRKGRRRRWRRQEARGKGRRKRWQFEFGIAR